MVLKKCFGDYRVCHIKDEGQRSYTEEGGWALVGVRAEAEDALVQCLGDSDQYYSYEWSKANRQPCFGGGLKPHHLEKSSKGAHAVQGPVGGAVGGPPAPKGEDGMGEDSKKHRRSRSTSPSQPTRRSGTDATPWRGSRHNFPGEDYQVGERRHCFMGGSPGRPRQLLEVCGPPLSQPRRIGASLTTVAAAGGSGQKLLLALVPARKFFVADQAVWWRISPEIYLCGGSRLIVANVPC